ncbi:MAG: type II toxin-antitoxin system RelE/ParE family toxin [Kiritimatiellae bacterium]|jgi:mRNA interferase RelE/StbE|nr:type II toxin-antitoxin system RelE/ParE family toxin [Kiritimatiellia bacterium]
MDCFEIQWKKSAQRELRKLDASVVPRIIQAVQELENNPKPKGCRKLKGSEYSYRIRIGNYRVIYEIFETQVVIEIVRVRHRKDVYRGYNN